MEETVCARKGEGTIEKADLRLLCILPPTVYGMVYAADVLRNELGPCNVFNLLVKHSVIIFIPFLVKV